MKTFTKSLSGLLSASALAIGLSVIAQPALAGIDNSAHDLGTTDSLTTTAEICVFCHTPHGSNTAVDAPLWNKALPAVTYTPYTSATMDGVAGASSVSLACLSCHDGTQARDNMINKPGSGGYTAGGSNLGTLGVIANNVTRLGTDLSNDHPIGMTYCAALSSADALLGTCGDDSFNTAVPAGTIAGTELTRIWLDTNGDSVYQKTDFPLYGGNSLLGAGVNVECATCHDPHNAGVGAPPTFLRVSNTGSAVCLACHNK